MTGTCDIFKMFSFSVMQSTFRFSNLEILAVPTTSLVNLSLSSSTFPQQFKDAVVTPILKKASLNPEILKNYRPVSNLPYISKIVEKAVSLQISSHLEKNDLSDINPLIRNNLA